MLTDAIMSGPDAVATFIVTLIVTVAMLVPAMAATFFGTVWLLDRIFGREP